MTTGINKTFYWAVQRDQESEKDNKYGGILLDWILTQVSCVEERNEVFWSDNQWFFWRERIEKGLLKSLGLDPMPPRTPLNVRCVGTVEREGYRIEKLILEPRPFFMVPAHLYVPQRATFPAPAIIYSVGHWMKYGKMEPDVQACCIGLVRLGFVVLVYDPIGQGERGCSFYEHGHRDLLLVGLSQEGLMVWESIRMIDYLLSRPEVDGNLIGMTGASGGGLNTLYTTAVDKRVTVAVPVCYVTSFSAFLKAMRGTNWNGGIDLCNQVPNVLDYGDMAALCALIAPRPLMIVGGTQDPQFPIEGTRWTFQKVQVIYGHFRATERVSLVEIDAGHGYIRPMREYAYAWFSRWLLGKECGVAVLENSVETEDPEREDFRCFPWNAPIVSGSLIARMVEDKRPGGDRFWRMVSREDTWLQERQEMLSRLQHVLNLRLPLGVPKVWKEAECDDETMFVERMLMSPEEGITVPFYHWQWKDRDSSKWVVCIQDEGKLSEATGRLLEVGMRKGGFDLFTVDLRGFGETSPVAPELCTRATVDGTLETVRSQPGDTLEFEVATNSLMLGRPLLGQQIQDLLCFLAYLKSIATHEAHSRPVWIGCFASGVRAALVGLFASAIESSIAVTVLDPLLLSYSSLLGRGTLAPMGIYIFDVLSHFDLPQVAALIAPRRLCIGRCLTFVGAEMREVEDDHGQQTYAFTRKVYELFGKKGDFRIERRPFVELCLEELFARKEAGT